ncbi:protein kinase [Actinospica durhamensis]|uniref:non-specific serine/threonine protein kinase n=1 Tax=Actinospica durhamensis TaxID=1508375 RepID=A0A941INB0_9ACTN|nr:protein kinase [Actinospica durhamensis]MBR7831822.1 protein kinase [Actinospica durhamensis]
MMPDSSEAVFADLAGALGVTELIPLARGGQKFVLRALRGGRAVAVKAMFAPPGPAYAAVLDRARRETAVLAAVDSPRLVRMLDGMRELRYGGALPYGVAWVEELLDGTDLDKLLGTPWPPGRAARLLAHLAEALAALHAQGIVHRDLNPGNVRQRAGGDYCVMDPGLAHRVSEQDPGDAHCIGTVGYLSPEHTAGGVIGPASDVYCLGILMFQALTGVLPSPEVSLPPGTPSALAGIVTRCLRPDPGQRFADGGALLAELETHPQPHDDDPAHASEPPPTPLFGPDGLAYAARGEDAVELRGSFGSRIVDVESVAKDQSPFAIRLSPCRLEAAPGVTFTARTIELEDGRFTNAYELAVDTRRATVGVHSSTAGFYLTDLMDGADRMIAAVNGSFSFISDDFEYEPADPCLDFCARDGITVSLPTVAKPAFIVGQDGGVQLRELDARGTLRIGEREYAWIGSKTPALPADEGSLSVYGAANCRVEYAEAARVALLPAWTARRTGRRRARRATSIWSSPWTARGTWSPRWFPAGAPTCSRAPSSCAAARARCVRATRSRSSPSTACRPPRSHQASPSAPAWPPRPEAGPSPGTTRPWAFRRSCPAPAMHEP